MMWSTSSELQALNCCRRVCSLFFPLVAYTSDARILQVASNYKPSQIPDIRCIIYTLAVKESIHPSYTSLILFSIHSLLLQ